LFAILPRLRLNPLEVFGHGAYTPILPRRPFSQSQSCLPVIDPTEQENFGNFSGFSAYAVMRTEISKIQNFLISEKSVLLGD
jgi:hypothetical protein